MDKVITCINCPVGCRMTVAISGEGTGEEILAQLLAEPNS